MVSKSLRKWTAVSTPLIAVVMIAIIAVGAVAVYFTTLSGNAPTTSSVFTSTSQVSSLFTSISTTSQSSVSTATQSSISRTASPANTTIVSGLVTIQAGSYTPYQFVVPNGTTNAHVTGTFSVQGGSGNILVVIMDPTNYAKFQNSQQSTRIYDSGQVTSGNVNQALPPGTYDLVFTNKFDTTNAKTVSAQVSLVYSG